jgi:pimeloyl-ACP methyl ester carboxylesterase
MNAHTPVEKAVSAATQFIDSKGRTLAYRSIGQGQPIVLCLRYRAVMDEWDPLFLDSLAANGLRVITFDYTGLGQSTGERTYDAMSLAQDAVDLIEALDLTDVIISGWSLGGMAAEIVVALHPERISHGVFIGTTPPGPLVKLAEQLFFETATKPHYTLDDNTILFFEPKSASSRAASEASLARINARTADRSPPVDPVWAAEAVGGGPANPIFPADAVLEALKQTGIPMLHIGGDHDIIFPVENWYALNGQIPNLQLLTYPASGHGPQHQFPEACADYIATFARTTG